MSKVEKTCQIMVRDNFRDLLDAIEVIDSNSNVLASCINDNHETIEKLLKTTTKLGKKIRRTRFGMFVMMVGGIVYIIRNEKAKDELKKEIINIDRCRRSITPLETEGEALEPTD
ncbi:MAG: hypothetical protein J6U54_03580 [Clostridiales bacterium]|nr:hypothetical protein [Clostridiales bacterium]